MSRKYKFIAVGVALVLGWLNISIKHKAVALVGYDLIVAFLVYLYFYGQNRKK